ncbi:transient receptor potential cation channel subfamily V member 5-like [Crassostrea virginica]
MDRKNYIRRSTNKIINKKERKTFLGNLEKEIKNCATDNATTMLTTLEEMGEIDWLDFYDNPEHKGETLLHLAVKYIDETSFISQLTKLRPKFLLREREDEFKGQTALHIAITKDKPEVIRDMLKVGQSKNGIRKQMSTLLHIPATGPRFVNTVMMGQLPLTVAALKGNEEVIGTLLKYGADLHKQNEEGDTVLHSLVKYSATYPEKIEQMQKMMQYLQGKLKNKDKKDKGFIDYNSTQRTLHCCSFVWFLENKDKLTPLQLAAKCGVTNLVEQILNMNDVYCFLIANDGLFDVKEYDVTEIDTVSIIRQSEQSHRESASYKKSVPDHVHGIAKNVVKSNYSSSFGIPCCAQPKTESILKMLFGIYYNSQDAYRIIELPPIKYIVVKKWEKYKWIFRIWMAVHYIFMVMLTIYSVENVKISIPNANGTNASTTSKNFVSGFRWISFTVGLLYFFIAICLLVAKSRKNNKDYRFHNLEYIIPMLVMSVAMNADAVWSAKGISNNIPLICALICGWWLNVFFLSPIEHFSFLTVMIKRVIIGDLFRFGLVIFFGIISFTAGMYMMFRGTNEDDYTTYGSTMMAMFKLGIGIADVSVLYSARIPWMAITIFILFTIFTYLLMLNALIAMMSQTCSLVFEERFPLWRIQQLSVILLMEDILFTCCFHKFSRSIGTKKTIRGIDPITKQLKYRDRYFVEIHSLQQMEYATEEDKCTLKKKLNDTQFFASSYGESKKSSQRENKKSHCYNLQDLIEEENSPMPKVEIDPVASLRVNLAKTEDTAITPHEYEIRTLDNE